MKAYSSNPKAQFKKLVVTLTLFCFFGSHCFAQASGDLSGSLVNQQKQPVSYATVLLFSQQDTIALYRSVLSDSTGQFSFQKIAYGNYQIRISCTGYRNIVFRNLEISKPITRLPAPVLLMTDEKMLQGVTITSARPFLERQIDKLVVNVSNSVTSAGATALEILQKVPGVKVINDHISLAGKTGVVIMIDGKPSPYTDLEGLLKDIPGGNIDKIEVIANPGAKYEASGSAGILNLILKKSAGQGLTGSYFLGSGYSYYDQRALRSSDHSYNRYNGSLSLDYRNKRWNIYGSLDYLHRYVFEVNNFDRIIGSRAFDQLNYYPYYYNTLTYRFGADYRISKKSTLGVLLNGNYRGGNGMATTHTSISNLADHSPLDSFMTRNLTTIRRFSVTANLHYEHLIDTSGRVLTADADYSAYRYTNAEDITITTPVNVSDNYQLGKNPLYYATLKADYTHPLKAGAALSAGAKYAYVNIDNDLLFLRNGVTDNAQTNRFNYRESIKAAYVSLHKKYRNFEYQIGLRAEQTATSGALGDSLTLHRNYLQLFPSVALVQKLGGNWSVNLTYSRRIDRPQFVLLSPFSYYIDSLTYFKGNPGLLPQLTNSGKITLGYKSSWLLSLSYNHTTNTIYNQAPRQVGDVTYTQANNLGTYQNWVSELNFPVVISRFITGSADLEGIYNAYHTGYLGTEYHARKITFQSNVNTGIRISETVKAEVNLYYTSGTLNEFMISSSFSGLNLGLQKAVFSGRGKLSLSANDIFYKNPLVSAIAYQNILARYFYRDDSRNLRLSFSYNFGSSRADKPAARDLGSKDENRRLNN